MTLVGKRKQFTLEEIYSFKNSGAKSGKESRTEPLRFPINQECDGVSCQMPDVTTFSSLGGIANEKHKYYGGFAFGCGAAGNWRKTDRHINQSKCDDPESKIEKYLQMKLGNYSNFDKNSNRTTASNSQKGDEHPDPFIFNQNDGTRHSATSFGYSQDPNAEYKGLMFGSSRNSDKKPTQTKASNSQKSNKHTNSLGFGCSRNSDTKPTQTKASNSQNGDTHARSFQFTPSQNSSTRYNSMVSGSSQDTNMGCSRPKFAGPFCFGSSTIQSRYGVSQNSDYRRGNGRDSDFADVHEGPGHIVYMDDQDAELIKLEAESLPVIAADYNLKRESSGAQRHYVPESNASQANGRKKQNKARNTYDNQRPATSKIWGFGHAI